MKQFGTLVAAVVVGVIIGQWMMTSSRPAQIALDSPVVPISTFRLTHFGPKVTLLEYGQIRSGMNYWEVQTVIGDAGTEVSRNHMDGVPGVMESIDTVMYAWANGDGSNMNAMFQNDKLIQKAQFGLR